MTHLDPVLELDLSTGVDADMHGRVDGRRRRRAAASSVIGTCAPAFHRIAQDGCPAGTAPVISLPHSLSPFARHIPRPSTQASAMPGPTRRASAGHGVASSSSRVHRSNGSNHSISAPSPILPPQNLPYAAANAPPSPQQKVVQVLINRLKNKVRSMGHRSPSVSLGCVGHRRDVNLPPICASSHATRASP